MGILVKAKPENYFRCADGSALGSVYELENKLCTMSYETFCHHVNPARNDFHNWIRDVFQNYELADELLRAKTPAEAAAIVRKHLRKELLAKEEIENAIKDVSSAKTKKTRAVFQAKPAKAASKRPRKPRLKPRPQQKKTRRAAKKKAGNTAAALRVAAAKNRKLNKNKRNNRKVKKDKRASKRPKKKVNKWLNWLKIAPEL